MKESVSAGIPKKFGFLVSFLQRIYGWGREHPNGVVACIILFHLMMCTVLVFFHPHLMANRETDGVDYLLRSKHALDFDAMHGPGFPLLIAFFRFLGLPELLAGKLISVFSACLILFAIWKILQHIKAPYPFVILGIVSVNPLFLSESVMCLSDMVSWAFSLSGLAILVSVTRPHWYHLAGVGALMGFGYLCRYITMYPIAAATVVFLLVSDYKKIGKTIFNGAVAILFFFISTSPWIFVMLREKGKLFYNESYLNIAYSVHHEAIFADFPEPGQYSGLMDVIMRDPQRVFTYWVNHVLDLPNIAPSIIPIAGFLSLFGFVLFVTKMDRKKIVVTTFLAAYLSLISLAHFNGRFWIPMLPFFVAFAAYAWTAVPQRIHFERRSFPFAVPVLIFLSVPFLYLSKTGLKKRFSDRPPEWSVTYKWLNEERIKGKRIASVKPHFAYFSNNEQIPLERIVEYEVGFDALRRSLDSAQADFFIAEARAFEPQFHNVKFLMEKNSKRLPGDWEEVFRIEKPAKVVIYKLPSTSH